MTQPDVAEIDDTTPVADATSTDSPNAPAPAPPGDFTTGSMFSSPSTYITAVSYLLPVLSAVFHKDFSQYAQAISQLAPLVATAVLLVARNLHKREVIRANAQLALQRAHNDHDLQRDIALALVGKLTAAEAKKYLTSGQTLQLPVAA